MVQSFRNLAAAARRTPRRDWLLAAALLGAALLAYLPAMRGGLILDDDLHITRPEMQSLAGLARIWTEPGATQQYYPVLHSAFWLEHRLWGDSVLGYHLANVLLHALAALLVGAVARRLFFRPVPAGAAAVSSHARGTGGAWLAAFLFALHPVAVESVAWIAEQKNTLSAVFALGAVLAYLRFDDRRRAAGYLAALALFAAALGSKTSTVTLPAVLVVVLWWRRPGFQWRRDALPLLPWFALAAAVSLVTVSVERRLLEDLGAVLPLGFVGRCLVAGRAFWFYLGKLACPAGLTFFYPRWAVNAGSASQYLFPLAGIALAAWLALLARRHRGPLAAFLCYAGILFPVLGFFDVEWFVFAYVADHLQYLASAVVFIVAAAGFSRALAGLPPAARRSASGAAIAVLAVFGALTWRLSARYCDAVTFYRTAAAMNPGAAMAHNHLGAALVAVPGGMPEARKEFETALRLNPRSAEVHFNLGLVLIQDPDRRLEGVEHLEAAVKLRPGLRSAHCHLGLALLQSPDRRPEALGHLEEAVRRDPADALARDGLGLALLQTPGREGGALGEFEAAIRLRPDFAEAHLHFGRALAATEGRLGEAVAELEESLRLDPNLAEAHYSLGNALQRMPGRDADAMAQFEAALRLTPDFAEARNNLGNSLLKVPGCLPAAANEFREALRLKPDFAEAHNNLGIALARMGRLPEALPHFEEAVRLNPDFKAARENLAQARQFLGR